MRRPQLATLPPPTQRVVDEQSGDSVWIPGRIDQIDEQVAGGEYSGTSRVQQRQRRFIDDALTNQVGSSRFADQPAR